MSSQITTVHSSNVPSPVHNFSDVVGISILDTEDEKETDKKTILDFIKECNRKKKEEKEKERT
jgi:hypothetical protein